GKQDREDEDDEKYGRYAVHDHRPGKLTHGTEVVRRPGHQIAGAMLVKKRERLIDQTRVEVVSQIVFDMPGHADENTPLQKKKEPAECARTQDFRGGDGQLGPGNLSPFGIDGPADNQRNA